LLLVACGGGQTEDTSTSGALNKAGSAEQVSTAEVPSAARTQALQEEGAKLNTAELEEIAKTGVLPEPFEGPLLSGAEGSTAATLDPPEARLFSEQKSAASLVSAYRFFNGTTGAHFYTTSTTERDNVIATLPQFTYEGTAFNVSGSSVPGLSPVHRFYNTQTGVHFYTISEAERASVVANLPQFNYEGIAYYASTLSGTGYTPLYRFYVSARGFHFYTSNLAERDNIIATLPQYTYEGIGYYVLGDDWRTPAVQHTGVTPDQCYRTGSNTLLDCSSHFAVSLNGQQDGHRTTINPMSYSLVGGQSSTDCMRDNVTGLVWEVKAAGARAPSDTYQRALGFVGDPTTTGAYTTIVNDMNLCGFSDWRLPSMEELHGLVNFGVIAGPRIGSAFPNTQEALYWTATDSADDSDFAWAVRFDTGVAVTVAKSSQRHVRLVRGAPWVGQRYVVTTQALLGDALNNAVIDRKTGLIWRRCLQGQSWNGVNCTGSAFDYTHEQALAATNGATWRLPNAKELATLADRSQISPALDAVAFPAASDLYTWSTTPVPSNSGNARVNGFSVGSAFSIFRTTSDVGIRLVYTAE
jgi:hypothetical protein